MQLLVCRNWTAEKFYSIGSIFHLFPMKGSRGDLLIITRGNTQLPAFSDSPDAVNELVIVQTMTG